MIKALRTQPGELPLLAAIGGALRWLEELLVMASGPVLTFGLGVGLVALLTDGQLLASAPWLLYAWGIAMAVGVDGQLVGAAVKAGRAFRAHRWWHAAGYSVVIAALSYVAYLAAIVFATTQAQGISTAQALHLLGMDDTAWITQRSAVAVALVILSGALRYEPAKQGVESEQERRDRMARERDEAQHKATMRALQLAGLGAAIHGGIEAAKQGVSGDANPVQTPGEGGTQTPGNALDETPGNDTGKAGGTKGRGYGQKAVPSHMMSAPQFGRYLRDNGVKVSPEQAVAYVKSVAGCEKVGTMYAAPKAPLMRLANRLIERANTTSNETSEAPTLAG